MFKDPQGCACCGCVVALFVALVVAVVVAILWAYITWIILLAGLAWALHRWALPALRKRGRYYR
jgi:hypothetical protein